jgi:hypothetical protein
MDKENPLPTLTKGMKTHNLNAEIVQKLSLLPSGATIDELTRKIKDTQKESLLDTSLHEVLTIPANSQSSMVNRMTFMTDDRLMDDFHFKVHDVCGFKRFANPESQMMFENINNQIKESYMAMEGSFWNGIVSILAGRAPGETGMFRTLLSGFIHKLMDKDKPNIQ